MTRIKLAAGIFALVVFSGVAAGQVVPVNTGFNHAIPALSPVSPTDPSTTPDNYWINIASSFPPTTPATW